MTQTLRQDESERFHHSKHTLLHIHKFGIYYQVSNNTLSEFTLKSFQWNVFKTFMQFLSIYPTEPYTAVPAKSCEV
jgi:hypothetical protein